MSAAYTWEVDAEGIEALQPPTASMRGRKSEHNWTGIVDHELMDLQHNGSPLLEDPDALYAHLVTHLKNETGHPPKYPKRLRERIRTFRNGRN
jgi:hypothetical protein